MQDGQDLTTFDRNHDHNYLEHLVNLNNDQPVTASEDIYNQFGVLLIAKGSPINSRVSSQIHQHRLAKPLDHQVDLERCLSREDILGDIYTLLESCPEFSQIHKIHKFDAALKHLCLNVNLPMLVRQRLTVMKNQFPKRYQHSLFSAWMCGLFAKVLKLEVSKAVEAFCCGLIHDIGFLHLCPKLLEPNQEMTDERWRALQSHVVIGKMLIDELGVYSKELSSGVFEHHERMDRTGYPSRKAPDKLGLYGQMIGCADLIDKLKKNELSEQGRPLSACLSHLKVNHAAFRDDVYQAAFKVLSKVEYQNLAGPEQCVLHQRIGEVNQLLNGLTENLKGLHESHFSRQAELQGSSIDRLTSMIVSTFDSAGLHSSSLSQWVTPETANEEDDSLYQALVETDSVQYEMLWLFKRLGWGIEQVLKKPGRLDGESRKAVISFTEGMEKSLQSAWGQYQS